MWIVTTGYHHHTRTLYISIYILHATCYMILAIVPGIIGMVVIMKNITCQMKFIIISIIISYI